MRTRIIWLTAVLLIGFMGIGPSYAQEVVNLLPTAASRTVLLIRGVHTEGVP